MRKYVILRKPTVTRGDGGRGVEIFKSGPKPPQFAFERLTETAAASMALEPEVQAIAPAMATKLIRPMAGRTAAVNFAWGLDAIGASTSKYTGKGVTVAVLDTGIDISHPAFVGIKSKIEQEDFSGDGNGDEEGHGTHCAGTIFGQDVDGLRIGVAPEIQKALIGKVLGNDGGGDSEMIIEGIQWALRHKANIISMSLGFDFPGMVKEWTDDNWPIELATSNALEAYRVNLRVFDSIMDLTKARGGLGGGALVVAAAGNESRRDEDPGWRIAASLPAAADEVVSVAAVGNQDTDLSVADFSNSMALLSGPGVDIVSAKAGGGLETLSGTSMACPHVAGAAALWWESITKAKRTATPMNVRAQLIASARRTGFTANEEIDIGQGMVMAP